MRREARLSAREMMADPEDVKLVRALDAKRYADPDGPTFESLVKKMKARGLEGDALYDAIIESACRTNAEVDESLSREDEKTKDDNESD